MDVIVLDIGGLTPEDLATPRHPPGHLAHLLRDAGGPRATVALVDGSGAKGRAVPDIRQTSEFASGHVPGPRDVELGVSPQSTTGEIPDALTDLPTGARA